MNLYSMIWEWEKKQEKLVAKHIDENCKEGQRIYWIQFGNNTRYEGIIKKWKNGGQYADIEMDDGQIIEFEF